MTDMQRMRHATRTPEDAQAQWLGMIHDLAEQIQKQQQAFQQRTQEAFSSYSQLFNIPLFYTQEGSKYARFPIEGYDDLTVEEISGRVGGLSVEDLRMVRAHEERTKNRETAFEQLDRRIRTGS
jgi:hypothetical protein